LKVWFTESEAIERNIQSVVLSTKTVAERFGEDFAAFMNATLGPDFRPILRYCDPKTDCKVRDLAEETEIPRNLLVGSWTEESVRYLYWLVKSGAKLEWITSTSGEVRFSLRTLKPIKLILSRLPFWDLKMLSRSATLRR
jgi:hypothetical protein